MKRIPTFCPGGSGATWPRLLCGRRREDFPRGDRVRAEGLPLSPMCPISITTSSGTSASGDAVHLLSQHPLFRSSSALESYHIRTCAIRVEQLYETHVAETLAPIAGEHDPYAGGGVSGARGGARDGARDGARGGGEWMRARKRVMLKRRMSSVTRRQSST